MKIEERKIKNINILDVHENIDLHSAGIFKNQVYSLLKRGEAIIVLNVKDIKIDSAGLGVIIALAKNKINYNTDICFLNLSTHLKKIFQINNLDLCFPIFDTEEEALKQFNYFS